jgi:molybdenum cofactor biosynthesis protein A
MLKDRFERTIDYLRISVTDRCNLRCFYCMPAEGMDFVPRQDLLTWEEMLQFLQLMVPQGIRKVRFTGGEPFVRKDFMPFLEQVAQIPGLDDIRITTNGTLTESHLEKLKSLGITDINLSLDTLNHKRFLEITRRDSFGTVYSCLMKMFELGFKVKINMVVMEGVNTADIVDMARLAADYQVDIRFIEEMPFNGKGDVRMHEWNYKRIKAELDEHWTLEPMTIDHGATSQSYQIAGFQGVVGIIAAYSRTFCGTCNRLRINSTGQIRTCLYAKDELDIRKMLRDGSHDNDIVEAVMNALAHKAKDGFEAEDKFNPAEQSMSSIGG